MNDTPHNGQPQNGGQLPPPPAPGQPNHPPVGTYPPGAGTAAPPSVAYPPPPPPEPPRKSRRVGTFTMAVCLIAVGVLLLLRLFIPQLDVAAIARFSPLVLVLLGVELLIANFRFKEEKLRFDGLSVFVSIVLIAVSLVAAVVPDFIHYEIEGTRIERRLTNELNAESRVALQQAGVSYSNVEWYVNLEGAYHTDMTSRDIYGENYVQMRAYLIGPFADEKAFADACRRAITAVRDIVPHIDYASFHTTDETGRESNHAGDIRYSLYLNNRYQPDEYYDRLESLIEREYWLESESHYISESEWEHRLANPEYYADAPPTPEDPEDPEDPAESEADDSAPKQNSAPLAGSAADESGDGQDSSATPDDSVSISVSASAAA